MAKRVVLGAAPHLAVQILDTHAGGAGAREVLEDLPLLGRKGQLAVLPAYATAIELQGEIEMRGRLLACVEDPRSSALPGDARRRPVESQPRDPGCERPDRSGRTGADVHAGAGAGAPERLVPELGNGLRPGSAELRRALLEVARPLRDEGANQVRANQQREIAVPLRHGRAARDRGDRFAGPAQPGPGLAAHELHAGELVERTGAAVPGFRARGGGFGFCQIAALERTFRGAQPRIRMRGPESAAWRRAVPGIERPRLDPRQRRPPGARKRQPASFRRLAALPARLAKQSEIHLARRPEHAEPGLGGNPGGDADELLGALELAEPDCASGEVVRDTGAEDPIRAPIERAECGLSDLHRLLHLAAPEEDPRPEEDRRSLGKAAVVAGRPAAGLAGGDLGRPVDLIESHQRGDLDDRHEDVDRGVAAQPVSFARLPGPGEGAIVALLQQIRKTQGDGPAPFQARDGTRAVCESQQGTPRAVQVAAQDREIGEAFLEGDSGAGRVQRAGPLQLLRGVGRLPGAHQCFGAEDAAPIVERRRKVERGEAIERTACGLEVAPAQLLAGER